MKSLRRAGADLLFGVFVVVYISTAFYLVEYLQKSYSRDVVAERTYSLTQQLALVRSRLEAMVTSEIFRTTGIVSYIAVAPNSSAQQWLPMAEQLLANAPHIRNIAVAPNNVVSFVYPQAGNEQAFGLDYRQYPNQLRTVEVARQTKQIFVAGPLALVQGGMGVIARMPIFTDPPQNSQYWGVASVVLDWEQLLEDSGALAFPAGVQLAIRGVDGTGDLGPVFYGKLDTFRTPLLTENISMISGRWTIAIKADESQLVALGTKYQLVRLFGYSLSVLIFISIMVVLNAYRNAQRYSYQDVLTKLGNRRFITQVLKKLISRRSRFAIINIDLNQFKMVNDSFGHPVGDALLVEVAHRLESSLRSYDALARVGGDEFLLVLPRITRQQDLQAIVDKIREQVCGTPFEHQGVTLVVSLSIGVAIYPDDGEDLEELFHRADSAMYQDKHRHHRRTA
ncbi:sensor domain-containing diguanylate cyclase [Shewanella avicenniae]|uniref:Sensor domain-containing diguanylate cyclase n=1 Tax=Shewanella avicenniae TaxID=2814294 RepID=A0ABX7QS90_9GAMM|nr:diguanylate cyclase [Shewanella avicenniae]QSX33907.1 sensor domain-containing diguanylate cyclase [Shewanella avicenniae]